MIIGIPKEAAADEQRVALTPDVVRRIANEQVQVSIEAGAGQAAAFPDDLYREVGAGIAADADALWRDAETVVKIHPPTDAELARIKPGLVVIGMFQPLTNPALVAALTERGATSFSLDMLPRITRAQPMDVLSSMSTVAGYKAVLIAAGTIGKFFPMLVTAAGTIRPATVLVLGAGVAGLQAIATARRLGAVVEAFDVRPVVKEQVESLGAKFIAAEAVTEEGAGEGGYAKELSDEQHKRELELIHSRIKAADVVITTALIPGRPAPTLVTDAMLRDMKPGSVIVDLAAIAGGNCERARAGETVVAHRVTIVGPVNLPSTMPHHASMMYAKNMSAFLSHIVQDGAVKLDFDDEITRGTCITHDGRVVSDATRKSLEEASVS